MIPTPVDLHGDNDCSLRVVETHISRLFFVEDVVYKSKKPVVNAFIDYSTSEKRRIACLREIELNARLSPDAYLGVLDLCVDGMEVDHVVMMKRYPDSVRLSSLLGTTLAASYLEQVAGKILELHNASLPCQEVDESASVEAVTELVTAGFAQLSEFAGSVLDTYDLRRAEFLALRYLQGRGKLFEDRVASGAARDGHGDLQADDIFCLEDGPRILDCLEFDDTLRYCDELSDVAFLAMDLERLGHLDLAAGFLRCYQELAVRSWPKSLEDFYIAYRALIRSKVACLRSRQGEPTAATSAQELLGLATNHLESASVRLVLIGGLPGTGKSSLAGLLAAETGAQLLRSDLIRDEILPRAEFSDVTEFGQGRYRPDLVEAVYAEMLLRAGRLLERGEHVVLDASWSSKQDRKAAEALAAEHFSVLSEFRCECPTQVAQRRIEQRLLEGQDASEATALIAAGLAPFADPWPNSTLIDTEKLTPQNALALVCSSLQANYRGHH